MKVLDANEPRTSTQGAVVSVGVFDGVHRGHQRVLADAVARANATGRRAVVVTFDPTPAEVLAPERAPKLLQRLEDRLDDFARLGVDETRVVRFSAEASQEEARDFVARVLVDHCVAEEVVVGTDFHFGKDRGGNLTSLRAWGEEFGFTTSGVALEGGDDKVSSTRIRGLVADGRVSEAAELLGRPFSYRAVTVVHGDNRGGAELGYPTANVDPSPRLVRPALGIYAGEATLSSGARHAAAISVGKRPQFYEDGELLIEAYLLDFSGDLYGQPLDLAFTSFLRGEMKFASVDELIAQMARDVAQARALFVS